jgi:hypothetical protein
VHGPIDNLDVRLFWASPLHAYHFEYRSDALRPKIEERLNALRLRGIVEDKRPIINIQESPQIVEVHDGNLSTAIWMIWAETEGVDLVFGTFRRSFPYTLILKNRRHPNGELWHPFVPPEVACAQQLAQAVDHEQKGRVVRKAATPDGKPVYFNDTQYFSGIDASVQFGVMIDRLKSTGFLTGL